MEEIWRDIVGFEGLYQVSNLGRIKYLSYYSHSQDRCNIVIKDSSTQTKNTRGYCVIKSDKKDGRIEITVHRAVAQAFPEICGEWFDGCIVHHIDGNKENNNADNLIVISKKQHHQIHSNDGVTYKKVSEKLKGHKKFPEHVEKIVKNRRSYKGEGNPFYGKKHTEESKEKNRLAHLKNKIG